MAVVAPTLPRARAPWVVVPLLAAFLAVGGSAVYRYFDNFWLYRGFQPPHDPAWVALRGHAARIYVTSAALGGRSQPVDVFLPPGYGTHPNRRYGVMYLLHGVPGRPAAFLQTVRLGVVEDELVALHRARPLILVMPFGSSGSFTDKEWANGVGQNQGWATFVSRDLVRAVDARFRTVRSPHWRVLAGLSEGGYGALNIGLHHPREFGVLESWSGYARADDIGSIFGHRRTLLRPTARSTRLPPRRPRCARPACSCGSTAAATIGSARRTPRSRPRSRTRGSRTGSASCAAATTGPSGAVTRGAPTSSRHVISGTRVRRAAAFPLSLAVVIAATGWLYATRGLVDVRPRVGEALPLDELARHSSISLATFVVVWGVTALLLGAIARWAHVARLVAASVLAVGVGAWQYAALASSIAVVRQIPAQQALDAAARSSSVYAAAAIAALGGALLAGPDRRRPVGPLLIATLVAFAGALDLAHGILPGENEGVVRALTPDAVGPLTRAAATLRRAGPARRRPRARAPPPPCLACRDRPRGALGDAARAARAEQRHARVDRRARTAGRATRVVRRPGRTRLAAARARAVGLRARP